MALGAAVPAEARYGPAYKRRFPRGCVPHTDGAVFQTYVGEANDPWSCLHSVREQFPGANGATFPAAQVCTPVSDASTARPSGRTLTTRSRVGPQGAPDGETANGGVRTCRECYHGADLVTFVSPTSVFSGCFLALGSGLRLVGTAWARR